jgi:hypothetical protein
MPEKARVHIRSLSLLTGARPEPWVRVGTAEGTRVVPGSLYSWELVLLIAGWSPESMRRSGLPTGSWRGPGPRHAILGSPEGAYGRARGLGLLREPPSLSE